MGFIDDVKKQTKQFASQYSKMTFPDMGDVDENIINIGVKDAISALETEYKLHVMEGRKNVQSRMLGYYYGIWMGINFRLGYDHARKPISLSIHNHKKNNTINCSNFQPIDAFLKKIDKELKKDFSNIRYRYDLGSGYNFAGEFVGREHIVTSNVNKTIKDLYYELKREWRAKEKEWKNNPKVEFLVWCHINIETELKCDKNGVVI